jgi:hypothetical protein
MTERAMGDDRAHRQRDADQTLRRVAPGERAQPSRITRAATPPRPRFWRRQAQPQPRARKNAARSSDGSAPCRRATACRPGRSPRTRRAWAPPIHTPGVTPGGGDGELARQRNRNRRPFVDAERANAAAMGSGVRRRLKCLRPFDRGVTKSPVTAIASHLRVAPLSGWRRVATTEGRRRGATSRKTAHTGRGRGLGPSHGRGILRARQHPSASGGPAVLYDVVAGDPVLVADSGLN